MEAPQLSVTAPIFVPVAVGVGIADGDGVGRGPRQHQGPQHLRSHQLHQSAHGDVLSVDVAQEQVGLDRSGPRRRRLRQPADAAAQHPDIVTVAGPPTPVTGPYPLAQGVGAEGGAVVVPHQHVRGPSRPGRGGGGRGRPPPQADGAGAGAASGPGASWEASAAFSFEVPPGLGGPPQHQQQRRYGRTSQTAAAVSEHDRSHGQQENGSSNCYERDGRPQEHDAGVGASTSGVAAVFGSSARGGRGGRAGSRGGGRGRAGRGYAGSGHDFLPGDGGSGLGLDDNRPRGGRRGGIGGGGPIHEARRGFPGHRGGVAGGVECGPEAVQQQPPPPHHQHQHQHYRDISRIPAPAVSAAAAGKGNRSTVPAVVAAAEPTEAGGGGSDSEGEGGTLTCVICCEEVAAVAVGACDHSHTCARCCLRLRLCYRDMRCPLCKAINEEVVVARPPLPPGVSFASLAGSHQQREALWQQPRWAKGVLVYDPPALQHNHNQQEGAAGGGRRGRALHSSLLAMTSRSCCVCDRHGRRPFGTMNMLLGHLRSAHDRVMCDVCLGAGLKFPLEYPAFDVAGLAAHMASEHPRCEYCDMPFYGRDELYAHMTQRHFTCHVCSRLGRHHLYFPDADTLMVHLREEHHACDHPDCFGCMIVFASRDELTAHIRDRHSAHMPRWDQSRARPMLLDFITPRGPAAAAALAAASVPGADNDGRNERGPRRGRGGGGDGPSAGANASRHAAPHQRAQRAVQGPGGLADPDAFPSLQVQQQQPQPAGLGDVHDVEGGLAVIDDDLGMGLGPGPGGLQSAPGSAGARAASAGHPANGTGPTSGPGSRPGLRLAGVWAGRQPGSGTFGEDFPELAIAGGGGPSRSAWGWGAGAGSAAPHPATDHVLTSGFSSSSSAVLALRKVTVRCTCGRRMDHLALRPDEQAPALSCDRECRAAQRRTQLADAFGVAAVDSHVPYFDRHRTPNYTAELIQAAQAAGLEWVASLERDLARFLADPSSRRTSLAPGMSQQQRRLVHELAVHYGLASHSVGQGASRAVQLLRGAASGVPTKLLSAVATAMGAEELARMAASGGGAGAGSWVLRLVDVAPGANVHHYLRAWEGDYTISPTQPSSSSSPLLLTFTREAAFRDCCATLAGGVRGVFRTVIERDRERERTTAASGSSAMTSAPAPAPPPGWQVLRSKASTASGARKAGTAGAGVGGGDAAASVRAALAADAWDSGEEGTRQPQPARQRPLDSFVGAAGKSSSTADAAAAMSEPRLHGRGPTLDLAQETLWSALRSEDTEAGEEGGEGDREGYRKEPGGGGEAGDGVLGAAGEGHGVWEDDGGDADW